MNTLEQRMERLYGAGDLRLTYGIVVPAIVAIGFIIVFAVVGQWWLLAPTVLAVIFLTAVVGIGLKQMLDEEEQIESQD